MSEYFDRYHHWEPLAEFHFNLDDGCELPDDRNYIYCLCSRVFLRDVVTYQADKKYESGSDLEVEMLQSQDGNNQSQVHFSHDTSCKIKCEKDDGASCYYSESHTENNCSTDEQACSSHSTDYALQPSDSGADLIYQTHPSENAQHELEKINENLSNQINERYLLYDTWETFWSSQAESLICASWLKKYSDYVNPEYFNDNNDSIMKENYVPKEIKKEENDIDPNNANFDGIRERKFSYDSKVNPYKKKLLNHNSFKKNVENNKLSSDESDSSWVMMERRRSYSEHDRMLSPRTTIATDSMTNVTKMTTSSYDIISSRGASDSTPSDNYSISSSTSDDTNDQTRIANLDINNAELPIEEVDPEKYWQDLWQIHFHEQHALHYANYIQCHNSKDRNMPIINVEVAQEIKQSCHNEFDNDKGLTENIPFVGCSQENNIKRKNSEAMLQEIPLDIEVQTQLNENKCEDNEVISHDISLFTGAQSQANNITCANSKVMPQKNPSIEVHPQLNNIQCTSSEVTPQETPTVKEVPTQINDMDYNFSEVITHDISFVMEDESQLGNINYEKSKVTSQELPSILNIQAQGNNIKDEINKIVAKDTPCVQTLEPEIIKCESRNAISPISLFTKLKSPENDIACECREVKPQKISFVTEVQTQTNVIENINSQGTSQDMSSVTLIQTQTNDISYENINVAPQKISCIIDVQVSNNIIKCENNKIVSQETPFVIELQTQVNNIKSDSSEFVPPTVPFVTETQFSASNIELKCQEIIQQEIQPETKHQAKVNNSQCDSSVVSPQDMLSVTELQTEVSDIKYENSDGTIPNISAVIEVETRFKDSSYENSNVTPQEISPITDDEAPSNIMKCENNTIMSQETPSCVKIQDQVNKITLKQKVKTNKQEKTKKNKKKANNKYINSVGVLLQNLLKEERKKVKLDKINDSEVLEMDESSSDNSRSESVDILDYNATSNKQIHKSISNNYSLKCNDDDEDDEPPEEKPISLKRSHELDVEEMASEKVTSTLGMMGFCTDSDSMPKGSVVYRKRLARLRPPRNKQPNNKIYFDDDGNPILEQANGSKLENMQAHEKCDQAKFEEDRLLPIKITEEKTVDNSEVTPRSKPLDATELLLYDFDSTINNLPDDNDAAIDILLAYIKKLEVRYRRIVLMFRRGDLQVGPNYGLPPEIAGDAEMLKYWRKRHSLFHRFDEGIRLDRESWFSVTPENVARHIADKCKGDVVLDAFCGAGGNTIQFALSGKTVIAVDIDPVKINMARHNAKVYGVEPNIIFIVGDFFKLSPILKADVVFLSPPWGGPKYSECAQYDIETMLEPRPASDLMAVARQISKDVVLYLPRNTRVDQILKLAKDAQCSVELEQSYLGRRFVAITAYYYN